MQVVSASFHGVSRSLSPRSGFEPAQSTRLELFLGRSHFLDHIDRIVNHIVQQLSSAVSGGIPHQVGLADKAESILRDPSRSSVREAQGFRLKGCRLLGSADEPRLIHLVLETPSDRVDGGACWTTLQFAQDGEPVAQVAGDLASADLRGLECTDVVFFGADLRGAKLAHARLNDCNLDTADLSHADLQGARLASCGLACSNLSMTRLQGARFTQCDLLGTNFENSSLFQATVVGCWTSPATVLPHDVAVPANLQCAADVLKGPGQVVVISEYAPSFVRNFAKLITKHHVTVFTGEPLEPILKNGLPNHRLWVRDYWFKSQPAKAGQSFRLFEGPDDPDELPKGDTSMRQHQYHSLQPMARGTKIRPSDMPPGGSSGLKMISSEIDGVNVSLGICMPGAIEQATRRFIPGGNLLTLDKVSFPAGLSVVGTNAIIYEMPEAKPDDMASVPPDRQQKVMASYPRLPDYVKPGLWLKRKAGKAELTEILGVKKAIFVPQVFYHTDLLGMYFGRDLFGLHSFQKTTTFLMANESEMVQSIGRKGFDKLLKRTQLFSKLYDRHIDAFSRRLLKQNVKVIELSAILVEDMNYDTPKGQYSAFPNGVSYDPDDGGPLAYYTPEAKTVPAHMRYFKQTCAEHGIEVTFVGNEDGSDPMDFVNQNKGSLRCMTAFNLVGQLNHPPHS